MTKIEYIFLDGGEPQQLRSKTKVINETISGLSDIPIWGFDGSSTEQAEGHNSDCVLKPIRLYENPLDMDSGIQSYLVLCEVWNVDDSPHNTNHRFWLEEIYSEIKEQKPWFGFEQEYTLFKRGVHSLVPLGWPEDGSRAKKQGDYYCGRNAGEDIVRQHMDACIMANIGITGINSEVMLGQWEYQIFGESPLKASDDVWVARWLMEKICSEYGIVVSLHPKPRQGDWNGAGMHTNFSTNKMREENGKWVIQNAIKNLEHKHLVHIAVYGEDNEQRLTGKHETCDINTFKWGVSDRGASIRIPWQVDKDGKGYLEDRRPAANSNPYQVCTRILKTVCGE